MDLDELRAFIAVVETGSFSAAAKSLRFARATLRRRIDQLEARIGVSLLERDDGRVRPTPAGSLLVEQGAGVLQEARALLESIRALDRNAMQEVHIVGLPGPPSEVMSLGLRTLRAALPNTRQRLSLCEDPVSMLGSTSPRPRPRGPSGCASSQSSRSACAARRRRWPSIRCAPSTTSRSTASPCGRTERETSTNCASPTARACLSPRQ